MSLIKTDKDLTVSIVVPSHNGGGFIHQLCTNLKHYHDLGYEIVFVENGLKDDLEDILKEYLPNAQYIYEPVANVAKARNLGVANCSGDYIQFLDVDDTIEVGKLDAQLNYAHKYGLDLVYSDWRYILHYEEKVIEKEWKTCSNADLIRLIISEGWHPLHSYIFKRQVYDEIGGFDEGFKVSSEDSNLILEYLLHHKSGHVSGHFTNYHRYEMLQTLSYSRGHQFWLDTERTLRNHTSGITALKDSDLNTLLSTRLFSTARNLAKWNMKQALSLHQKAIEINNDFKPQNESSIFQFVYSIFGYQKAEQIAQLLNRFKSNKGVKGHNSGIEDGQLISNNSKS